MFENGDQFADPFKTIPKTDNILSLFEEASSNYEISIDTSLTRKINGHEIEIFRTYTDCLYAAYGTKWNGNAAATNGSLFVAQNGRLRRLTPIECERIMGFPDNYTLLPNCKITQRYKATGNSWATNVIKWITSRLLKYDALPEIALPKTPTIKTSNYTLYSLKDFVYVDNEKFINATDMPYNIKTANMLDFIDTNPEEKLYISPAGCDGILRRKIEHNAGINARLEVILRNCSSKYKSDI